MRNFHNPFGLIAILWTLSLSCSVSADEFADKVAALDARNFDAKERAVAELEQTAHPRVPAILAAMLDSRLYSRKEDDRIVIVEPAGNEFRLSDAISGDDLGVSGKRSVKRINVNNQLRTALRTALARLYWS